MSEPTPTSTSELLLAADGAPAAASGGFDWFGIVLMIGAMGAIMYFMVYRPQQKERSAREALLNGLVKGDVVVTSGGLHGTVLEVQGTLLKLEIADRLIVTVDKDAILRKGGAAAAASSPSPAKG